MGKAAIEPTAIDPLQKAALRRLERVTGQRDNSDNSGFEASTRKKWKSGRRKMERMETLRFLLKDVLSAGTYEFVVTVRKTQFVLDLACPDVPMSEFIQLAKHLPGLLDQSCESTTIS